jgi:hypothetical protein
VDHLELVHVGLTNGAVVRAVARAAAPLTKGSTVNMAGVQALARITTVATLAAVTLTACAHTGPTSPTAADGDYATQWREHYADLKSIYPNAGDSALAIASKALDSGELGYDDYHRAAENFMDCAEAAGLHMNPLEEGQKVQGMALIGWSMAIPGDDAEAERQQALADSCYDSELAVVEVLYKSQPVANDWNVQNDAKFLQPMIECLTAKGVAVDDGSAMNEITGVDIDNSIASGTDSCAKTTGYLDSFSG